jgi:hypothetical protein
MSIGKDAINFDVSKSSTSPAEMSEKPIPEEPETTDEANEANETNETNETNENVAVEEVVITKNGLRLCPQPTGDHLDPLNWRWLRKHSILVIVMYM